MPLSFESIAERARRIRLLLLDVDGVLTDGSVEIDDRGSEAKRFYIRDGAALGWARREGLEIGFLSGRASGATTRRAEELGVKIVAQEGPDKRDTYRRLVETGGFADDEVAYMGDDLLDLPVLGKAGLSGAPADAAEEVRRRVHWISAYKGGRGAVREFVEVILRARHRWSDIVDEYLS